MLNKIFVSLMFLLCYGAIAYADYFEECKENDGTFIAVPEDCSFFIYCAIEDSYKDSCPEDNPYFSLEDFTCDTDRRVCGDRPYPNSVLEDKETTVAESAEILDSTIFTSSSIPNVSLIVHESTTSTPTSVQPTSSLMPSTTSSISFACPKVDNPNKAVFVPHPKSCSEYFLCYQGERLPMRCSQMLHFDFRLQRCDYAENVKCHVKDVISPRDQCMPFTFDVYPHPSNCNYYYKCFSGYLQVMQCPLNMGWHYEKRACMLRSQVNCYNSRKV